jgi:flagellar capping protein FliD
VLFGDSLLSTVRSTIQKSLFDVPLDTISNDTTGYSTLNIIGINSGNDGTLTIDQTKLDAKLSGDLSAFSDLFVDKDGFDNNGATVNTPEYYQDTSADSGLADKLSRAIDRMLSTSAGDNGTSIKGVFDSRLDSIAKTIRGIDDDIRKKQVYVDKFENDLLIKFSNLESTMSRLKAQGSGFAAAISGLTG